MLCAPCLLQLEKASDHVLYFVDSVVERDPPLFVTHTETSDQMRDLVVEILSTTEALYKIVIAIDPVSKSMRITYDDLDDDWFSELAGMLGK